MQTNDSNSWPRLGVMAHELLFLPDEVEHMIALMRALDVHALQLGTPLLEKIMANDALLAMWGDQLKTARLQLVALGAYRNLITPDRAKHEANVSFLQRCLAIAPQLGTAVVATETGTYSSQDDWSFSSENQEPEAWDVLCDALHHLLSVAEQNGTILALEGHVNHVINTPERLARLLEQFPTPHLQVVLDPYNYLGQDVLPRKEQVVAAFLRQFKDHFVLAHLKDVSQYGAESDTPAFGQGIFPQQLSLDFLRRERPDLPLILEHVSLTQIPEVLGQLRQATAAH